MFRTNIKVISFASSILSRYMFSPMTPRFKYDFPTRVTGLKHAWCLLICTFESNFPKCTDTTSFLSIFSLLLSHYSLPVCPPQPVLTVAFSMHCLKEAACISAALSVVTSSAVAATTLSTL